MQDTESARLDRLLRDDPAMAVWWGTPAECGSVLVRLQGSRGLSPGGLDPAAERLRSISKAWIEVLPTEAVREHALRLIRVHGLTPAAGFQLAAALVAAAFRPAELALVSLDPRLNSAAKLEGFPLLP